MSTRYVSADGHWHVEVIKLNGQQRIRVEHDTYGMGDGTYVPSHKTGSTRYGPVKTAHGWWVGDFDGVADVGEYVNLRELKEVKLWQSLR